MEILILHMIAEEDGRENEEDEKIKSICSFVKITLPDMKEDRVFTYHTWYSFNNESQQPAFAFGKNGWEALVFEEGKVKLLFKSERTVYPPQQIIPPFRD